MRKLFLLFYIITFCSCSILENKKREWVNTDKIIEKQNLLKTGDILIVNKRLDPYSIWGHSGIYIDKYNYIGEYPQIGYGFFYVPSEIWASELKNRKIIVLRLKNINDEFRKDLEAEIDANKYKNYRIVLDKNSNEAYYCSQWVWKMFQLTAAKYGQDLDLDNNGGLLVLPYDFLDSEFLEVVDLNI